VAILPMALADGAPATLAPRHAQAWAGALAREAASGVRAIGVDPEHAP